MGRWRAGVFGLLAALCISAPWPAHADGVGELTVTCSPPADLKIDGSDVGTVGATPAHYQLSAKHHQLIFTVPGRRPRRMGVSITENEENTLNVNL